MAIAHPAHPISGTIGNITYVRRGGKTYARERIWAHNTKANPRQRENRQSFGGASKAACQIYTTLSAGCKPLFRPYSHNYIAAKLRAHAERTERAVTRYSFRAAHAALAGLDLSHEGSPSDCLKITRLGSHHSPDAIRLEGLREAAQAVRQAGDGIHGNAHLQMRIHVRQVPFNEINYVKEDRNWQKTDPGAQAQLRITRSGWIPTEILPEEGLTLALPKPAEPLPGAACSPMLSFVVIEWREVRAVGDKVIPKPGQAIVRLAAMQYSPEMALEIARHQANIPKKPIQPSAHDLLETAKADPKAFLARSLGGLMSPPPA